jgi:DNA-binding transcriptional LysR family regulator
VSVTLQRLHYFVAVAEELSFTRAAERLNVSQPSLSEQVRRLERCLGVTLLTRTTRAVSLTEAGLAYLRDVRSVLTALDRAHERARDIQGATSTVRIAYTASTAYSVLPAILDALTGADPALEAVVRRRTAASAAADVLSGDTDIALVRDFTGAPRLVAETVQREPVAAFMASGHTLAGRGALSIGDLRGQTIVVLQADLSPGLHDLPGRLCAAHGFSPALETLPGLADRELLFARLARLPDRLFIGPASIAGVAWDGVVAVPITDDAAVSRVSAVWRDDGPSPAAAAALAAARSLAAGGGDAHD